MDRCRLCSSPVTTIPMMRIFDTEGTQLKLKERILNRLQIIVNKYDVLPTIICRACYIALEKCESFIENAQRTQEVLLKLFREMRETASIPAHSKTPYQITQEPVELAENNENDYCAEESAQEVRKIPIPVKSDQDMVQFIEVKPVLKIEPQEFPGGLEIVDGGLITDGNILVENSSPEEQQVRKTQSPNVPDHHELPRTSVLSQDYLIPEDLQKGFEMEYEHDHYSHFEPGDTSSGDECDDRKLIVSSLPDFRENAPEINTPPNSRKNGTGVRNELASQTRERYEQEYAKYVKWKTSSNISTTSESTLMTYFSGLSASLMPTTQWSVYSMLKSTILKNENINIEKYQELPALLKRNARKYTPRSAPLFTPKNIADYCKRAQNDEHLLHKVVMIFFLCGAKRTHELVNLTTGDVKLYADKMFLVRVPKEITKTKQVPYHFIIKNPHFFETVKKYRDLRPRKTSNDRFFIRYDRKNKQCTNQCVGINTLSGIPKQIAKFLQLPNPENYNTYSFTRCVTRRSVALVEPQIGDTTLCSKSSPESIDFPFGNVLDKI